MIGQLGLSWRREDLSEFDVRIESCSGDTVTVVTGDDALESQSIIRLRCSDGGTLG
jgi:hypothetical protein